MTLPNELEASPGSNNSIQQDGLSAADELEHKNRKKREKVRAAWISFVGRILAQILGAVATIALGLMVVHHYRLPTRAEDPGVLQQTSTAATAPARLASRGGVSIAVLPLQVYSDPPQTRFADAMTEAVIADLSQSKNLRVISRTSSMQYKSLSKAVPAIARELDVDLIIEGSVTSQGDRVRVTAQLIDARRDEHLWTETYDRTLGDVLAVQAEVASAITRAVTRAVAENWPARSAPAPTTGGERALPEAPAAIPPVQ